MREIYFDRIDSTNLYGKEHLAELEDKTVIFACRQTSGRGRLARSWIDLGGDNLFLSFVLKPSERFADIYSNLSQYLSVILCRLLEKYNVMPEIKWPNDVLVNGGKIAGILAETVMKGNEFKGLVLGVGVNLNVDNGALELVTDKKVTALNLEAGHAVECNAFRKNLCDMFFNDYEKFLSEGFSSIEDYYSEHSCFLNSEITVKVFNKEVKGIAKGLTKNGELLLFDGEKDLIINMGDIL